MIPPVGDEGIDTARPGRLGRGMAELLRVDVEEWKAQLPQFREYLQKFDNLPAELTAQLDALEARSRSSADRSTTRRSAPTLPLEAPIDARRHAPGVSRAGVSRAGRGSRRPPPAGGTPRRAR